MALIETAMNALDSTGSGYVQTAYNTVSWAVLPVAKVLFSIMIAWYGVRGMLGMTQFNLQTMFRPLAVIVLVMLFLTSWPTFQTYVFDIVIKAPEDLGKVIFSGFIKGEATSTNEGLQQAWDAGMEGVSAAFAQGGIFSLGAFLVGLGLLVGTIFFVALGFVIIAFAKIFAYVLMAIAPVFIVLAAFDWTRNWFLQYVNAVFHTMTLMLVAYSVIGLMLGISLQSMEDLQINAEDLTLQLTQASAALLYMFVGGLTFTRVPALAAMLAGGIAMDAGERWTRDALNHGRRQLVGGAMNQTFGRARRGHLAREAAAFQENRELRREAALSQAATAITSAIEKSRNS